MPRPSNPHLKDDLLRAAVSLLSDRGSPSFSMRDLAKEVANFVGSMSCEGYRKRVTKGKGFLTVHIHSKANDSTSKVVKLKLKDGVDAFESASVSSLW